MTSLGMCSKVATSTLYLCNVAIAVTTSKMIEQFAANNTLESHFLERCSCAKGKYIKKLCTNSQALCVDGFMTCGPFIEISKTFLPADAS